MISLYNFISEIKIQPNNSLPKIGKVYLINHIWLYNTMDEWYEYEIVDINDGDILLWATDSASKTFISEENFIKGIKNKDIKFIRQEK